ncbi:MAG: phosphatidylserine decarboxylase [Nitrospinae bacterium CG11_big_fil_rev_8_21_14_0_20_56_8]|nr:MAG: phosphatidylserine decarboxylase [Nitrospinae bacterium CG11_big_fil_rev_8_21_14_0_20_56_8]
MKKPHQFIDGRTGRVITEPLYGDPIVSWIYSTVRERAPVLFNALIGSRMSGLLGFINYQSRLGARLTGNLRFMEKWGIDLDECVDPPETLDTPRKIFERKIRYWDTRPLPAECDVVVSPADSRVVFGSLGETSGMWLKDKFFDDEELLGRDKTIWLNIFRNGDFAIFRLTPDKYHYNHSPVSGNVADFYAIDGGFHSCNPGAVVTVATPFSKNKRMVTIIDTDVPGGTGVGRVAMVEVVALMIGDILQCYSSFRYDDPRLMEPGLFMQRGQPKSLFRPGSSTVVLFFEKNRIGFCPHLLRNMHHPTAQSRYSLSFGKPLVETNVHLRSPIARRLHNGEEPKR